MEAYDNSLVEPIELRMIRPSQFPVRYADPKSSPELANLKSSIREHGLLQPIVVRPLDHGFEIVAGHRRFAACRSLRWRFIPCKIREFSDKHAYEIQLTENLQRKSMDPIEEAEAYQKYVVDFGWGKEEPKSKEAQIIRRGTLALKVTLSRIDDLIEDAHKVSAGDRVELIKFLMGMRRQTHAMIDRTLKYRKDRTKRR